jgi:hypothetical protein
LHGREADSTTGAVYQKALGRKPARDLKEGMIGGRVRNKQGGTLGKVRLHWQRLHLGGLAEREVRICAGECATGVYAISGSDVVHVRTDRLDDASGVRPRGEGKRGSACAVVASACVGVIRIYTDRAHANQHLLRIGPEILHFLELEYLGVPKRMHTNPLHRTTS